MKEFNFHKKELPDGKEIITAMSYKKAVKSFQAKHPELKYVDVGRVIKDGSYKVSWQKLPMGRKKKVGR